MRGHIIARTLATWQPDDWQRELARGYRDPAQLLAALGLAPDRLPEPMAADCDSGYQFPMRVPLAFARRMRTGDPADPLLRQVLPLRREHEIVDGFTADPVGDLAASRGAGVLHKYQGRALLITTSACAIHCRYCFRREFPYADDPASGDDWQAAVDLIAGDTTINEVILSGGDPLSLSTPRLAVLIERLAAIPHLRRLRLHSRLPVVLPARINDALVALLSGSRLKPVMVIHANHPNEIDDEVCAAMARMAQAGIVLLNQSVLLRGVNDDADSLVQLSEGLFEAGVTPYYLHLLDRVAGAAHFDVGDARALMLYREVHKRLPGYLVPRLVRERAGAPGKTLVA